MRLWHRFLQCCDSHNHAWFVHSTVTLHSIFNPRKKKRLHFLFAGQQPKKVDYELESDQFPVQHLTDYKTVTDTVNPIYGPCLTPPLPWVAPNRGCYRLCHDDNNFRVCGSSLFCFTAPTGYTVHQGWVITLMFFGVAALKIR